MLSVTEEKISDTVSRNLYQYKRLLYRTLYNSVRPVAQAMMQSQLMDTDELEETTSDGNLYHFGEKEQYNPNFDQNEWIASHLGTDELGEFRQPFVCILDDIRLLGRYPIPYSRSYRIPLDAILDERIFNLNLLGSALHAPKDVLTASRSEGTSIDVGFLLFHYWSNGYFHWYLDNLVQLRGVKHFENETGIRPTLIAPPAMSSWQRESLQLLGYGEDDLISWNTASGYADKLLVVTNQRQRPQSIRWLRDEMRLSDANSAGSERIYVSRADSNRRRVLNEDDLLDAIAPHNFKKFVPGNHSVCKQIRTMADAEVIVGPHGAGLTNLIHCQRDATVLELLPESDVRSQYFNLANKLGLTYRYQLCETSGTDLIVDTDKIHKCISDILNG